MINNGILKNVLFIIGILSLVAVCFSCNKSGYVNNYNINHYLDTIQNNVILTTVVDIHDNVSVSTLKLN